MGDPAFDYRNLSLTERLQLVEDIWDSIAEEVRRNPEALPLTTDQRDELQRRRADHDRDPDAAIPWDEFRQELFRRGK
jgi:putative addiction module component (TIGR02574 family)